MICCGYKGYIIKEYFANYFLHTSDVTFCMGNNQMEVHQKHAEPWKVTLVDTGDDTMTGGRLKRVADYLRGEEAFCFTYGDGVSDVDITASIAFHRQHGKLATITAVRPPGRYGALRLDGQRVDGFTEKPRGGGGLINGGFFVLSTKVIERIAADATSWEAEPLSGLATDGELMAFEHTGFWQPMDTLREKNMLEELWLSGKAPEALVKTQVDAGFWRGKRVLLTGHTGFKGAWLAIWLHRLGAQVTGIALPPAPAANLFDPARVCELVDSRHCDIRDAGALSALVREAQPRLFSIWPRRRWCAPATRHPWIPLPPT